MFNIAIDFIYKEICEQQFADAYGYKINDELSGLNLTGFADDQAVTAKSVENAIRIIDTVSDRFKEIGLEINLSKSVAIVIKNGKLNSSYLKINDEINKIPRRFLDALDVNIRESAKGIIGLPIHNTPTSMVYASKKFRGLGIICAKNEVKLQHFSIDKRLNRVEDNLFQVCRWLSLH